MKKRFFLLFVVMVFLVEVCSATRIHGIVYDNTLNPVKNCVVEVNSVPLQRLISKDGSYSFNLKPGDYIITAKYDGMLAKEPIPIEDDEGDYVIDLFLFPTFEEEEELLNETDFDVGNIYPEESSYITVVIIGIVLVVAFLVLAFRSKFRRKLESKAKVEVKEERHDLDDLDTFIKFIKEEGGRVTQKDIRRKFPLSEAKISLIISELEHKGIVEKIKKGRGNIIVLKK